ncbi:MAG: heavy-metal-associated domain-containing protein [Planctomycetes bacterium]|nr:heavy-metal-associated domain-containing protein [Planctomycetota bacterium]
MNTTTDTNNTTTLRIDGMTCGHCVQAVTKALSAVPGVEVTSVEMGSAVIEASDGWAAGKALAALDEAGYPAKAVGDAAGAGSPKPAKSGGGCCGGARNAIPGGGLAMPQSEGSAKTSGGCCR